MSRPDVSEERRPQIIDAAIRVFTRKGYRNATMPDVARDAGLSVGGVYWYFKGKDEIIAAILERIFAQDFSALTGLLGMGAPAAERLRAFVDGYVAGAADWQWMNAVGMEFYGEAAHNEKVRAVIQRYLTRFRAALAALIAQGIERGEFWPVDPVDTANALLALEEGLANLLAADPQGTRWRESFLLGCDLIIAGLKQVPCHEKDDHD
jgi:AcrR family transcriptional regulator